jgi:hypothetical protein
LISRVTFCSISFAGIENDSSTVIPGNSSSVNLAFLRLNYKKKDVNGNYNVYSRNKIDLIPNAGQF